jgi:signal peptidase I
MYMQKILSFFWEILKIIIIALVIVIPIRYFLFQPFLVSGQSMEPNFENNDYLIVDEISYRLRQPQRGEVIVFNYPNDTSKRFIKRVIGLPGETAEIKDGEVIIYDKNNKPEALDESSYLPKYLKTSGNLKVTLGVDEYFVLGDNRPASADSRSWGILPRKDIIGRVYVRIWPLNSLARIAAPLYNFSN